MNRRSLLVVRLSAIGDAVHALPALELVRAALPDWEIGWAVEEEAAPIVLGHPALDRVHVVERRALARPRGRAGALRRAVRLAGWTRRYAVAIDFQGLARSAIVARLLARRVLGSKHARELATLAYSERLDVPAPFEEHAVARNLALARRALEALGARVPESFGAPRFPPLPAAPVPLPERFLALLPGAGKRANRPPLRLLAGVARRVPELPAVVLGGAQDRRAGARLARAGAIDLTGRLTLLESAAVLARARTVLGGDTGPLHLARALGRPTVALFFAADPARTAPAGFPGSAPALLVRGGASCAPCLARTCRRPDRVRICLDPLDVDQVAERVRAAAGVPGLAREVPA